MIDNLLLKRLNILHMNENDILSSAESAVLCSRHDQLTYKINNKLLSPLRCYKTLKYEPASVLL